MADLTNGSGVYATYDNSGSGVAELGDNYASKSGNGIAGRTIVLVLTPDTGNVTQAQLDSAVRALGNAGDATNPDAFTVVGIDGAVGDATVHIAIQGTGTFTDDTSNALGITGIDLEVVADFAGLQA